MLSKSKVESPELSIIVTAHAEGIIAHKTMCCVFENQKLLNENHIRSEIVVHIDNGTKETKEYFKRYQNMQNIRLFENDFLDLGKSRNFASRKANGKYIAFIDADDLISSNWLLSALQTIKKYKRPTLVHPEAVLDFGINITHPRLWIQKNSKASKIENAKDLIVTNRWISTIAGLKQIFINFPYPPTEHGFGNEDYEFNLATISAGIPHLTAPKTILFYRKKISNSLLLQSATEKYVQRFSPLFDIEFYQKKYQPAVEAPKTAPIEKTTKEKIIEKYAVLRSHHPIINKIITPAITLAKKITGKTIAPTVVAIDNEERKEQIPEFVMTEWAKINKIDTSIYPNDFYINNLWFYCPEKNNTYSEAYYKLVKGIRGIPEYIFIVPWLISGGADKVLINYLNAFAEKHHSSRACVITTTIEKSTWQKFLPSNIDFVEFGHATNSMDEFEKNYLFSQLIVQLKCKKLHIINSDFAYRWVMSHRTLIKDNFELNVSIFTDDTLPGSRGKIRLGYANPHIVEIYALINRIYTDNLTAIKYLSNLNGFDEKKFTVHYQPNTIKIHHPSNRKVTYGGGKVKILWASRICTPKHPELLCEIARNLNPEKFEIDVFGRFDNEYDESIFSDIDTIHYRGTYDGINHLNVMPYDFFLYTSLNDGIPNILLEIISLGLPIIASNAGGVGETIINKKSGILVETQNAEDYIKAINYAIDHPDDMIRYAREAQNIIKTRHDQKTFTETVNRDLFN